MFVFRRRKGVPRVFGDWWFWKGLDAVLIFNSLWGDLSAVAFAFPCVVNRRRKKNFKGKELWTEVEL